MSSTPHRTPVHYVPFTLTFPLMVCVGTSAIWLVARLRFETLHYIQRHYYWLYCAIIEVLNPTTPGMIHQCQGKTAMFIKLKKQTLESCAFADKLNQNSSFLCSGGCSWINTVMISTSRCRQRSNTLSDSIPTKNSPIFFMMERNSATAGS